MQIYLEYALVENFCVDTALLYLSLVATKQKISLWRLLLAGVVGATFAAVFPLLVLPRVLAYLWKLCMGIFLCLLAIKKQKGRGRVLLTVLLFYGLSFCFGGALIAVFELFSLEYHLAEGGGVVTQIPVGTLLFFVVFFVALVRLGVIWLYRKRKEYAGVYACELTTNQRSIRVDGFLDTGNTATYQGKPVSFLSAELFYDLFGMRPPDGEMKIVTMAGEKQVKVYFVERMTLRFGRRECSVFEAYVSPTGQLRGRAYQMLIAATVLEELEN